MKNRLLKEFPAPLPLGSFVRLSEKAEEDLHDKAEVITGTIITVLGFFVRRMGRKRSSVSKERIKEFIRDIRSFVEMLGGHTGDLRDKFEMLKTLKH